MLHLLLASLAVLVDPARFEPKPTRLQLQIPECHSEVFADGSERPPMITVGSFIFTDGEYGRLTRQSMRDVIDPCPCVKQTPFSPIEQYVYGDVKPRAPRENRNTYVFVRGPQVNSGEWFDIASLERDGDTFTLTATAWRDDMDRDKNIPSIHTYAVRLGRLLAGEYKLHFVENDLLMHSETTTKYQPDVVKQQWVKFHVGAVSDPYPWDAPASTIVMREGELAQGKPVDAETLKLYQRPVSYLRRQPAVLGEVKERPALGTGNITEWLGAPGKEHYCELTPPKDQEPLFARGVCRAMGQRDTVEVSAVEWRGQTVTIHADVWRHPSWKTPELFDDEVMVPLETGQRLGRASVPATSVLATQLKVEFVWDEHMLAD